MTESTVPVRPSAINAMAPSRSTSRRFTPDIIRAGHPVRDRFHIIRGMRRIAALFCILAATSLTAQSPQGPDWARLEDETMRHFQALLRFDTSDPPGNEQPAADYLKAVLEKEP